MCRSRSGSVFSALHPAALQAREAQSASTCPGWVRQALREGAGSSSCAASAQVMSRRSAVGKHDDKNKEEDERKQQGNGQVPADTRISPKDPQGRHGASEPEDDEK